MPTHSIQTLFPTRIYRAKMPAARATSLNAELEDAIYSLAEDDGAGRDWCEANGYPGYTSYASLDDLAWRMPPFAELAEHLNAHAGAFAKELQFDLGGGALVLDSLWVNLLMPGGMHSGTFIRMRFSRAPTMSACLMVPPQSDSKTRVWR